MNAKTGILRTTLKSLAVAVAFQAAASADPITDLRSVSVFKDADLSKLSGGDILANRGPTMRFSRGLSVESAFIVRAPIKTTLGLLQQWNPLRHPELKVYANGDLAGKGPGEFSRVEQRSVQFFRESLC